MERVPLTLLQLFKSFNSGLELGGFTTSTGIRFLLDFRADLMKWYRVAYYGLTGLVFVKNVKEQPRLKPLDNDLKDLLQAWFEFGFLSVGQ
eukprot:113560-Prorocentrum_minimum.AAC.1